MQKKEQLTEIIRVRVTSREYKDVAARAVALGRSVSDYVRRVLLGKERP